MNIDFPAARIRAKIIGALLREERLKSRKTIEECAELIGLEAGDYEQIELGSRSPSLPELELLTYHLNISLDSILNQAQVENVETQKVQIQASRWIRLRQRMIGALLQQARLESTLSKDELSKNLGIETALLDAYELGDVAVPLPTLEALTGLLNRSLSDFQDQKGFVGAWNARQRALNDYFSLPPDLQAFVSKPVNRPYLELAVRLSEMSVDRLRAVAEGLLEITY